MNTTNTTVPTDSEIKKMDQEIRQLKRKVDLNKIAERRAFETQMRAVEDRFDLLKAKVDRFRTRTNAATDEFTEGLEKAWDQVKKSYKSAESYLH